MTILRALNHFSSSNLVLMVIWTFNSLLLTHFQERSKVTGFRPMGNSLKVINTGNCELNWIKNMADLTHFRPEVKGHGLAKGERSRVLGPWVIC